MTPEQSCHRLSMRTNCFMTRTAVPAAWSGVVFPTMRVSFMTLVSAKAQEAFRPLNPSAPHGPSSRTIGTVSLLLGCPFIPIPRSLALYQRLSPTLCSSDCPIPLLSVIVSDLNRSHCDSVLTRPPWGDGYRTYRVSVFHLPLFPSSCIPLFPPGHIPLSPSRFPCIPAC